MWDLWAVMRHSLLDILSVEEFHVYISQSRAFGCHSCVYIPEKELPTLGQQTDTHETVRYPSNPQWYLAELISSRISMLAVIQSIWFWCLLYIPQDFTLLCIIIFLAVSTLAKGNSRNSSAWWELIRFKQHNWCFIQCITLLDTATIQTPDSPLRCIQPSHHKYHPAQTLKRCL